MLRAQVAERRAGVTRAGRGPRASGAAGLLPAHVAPMLATASDRIPVDPSGWNFEWKWDGVRALAFIGRGSNLRLESRNLRDITVSYPELHDLAEALPPRSGPVILDGEIVALDDNAMPSFPRLQHRMHVGDAASARRFSRQYPVWYVLFDVLYVRGRSVMELPYLERRRMLEELTLAGPHWQVTAAHVGEGAAMLQAARKSRLEGIVAKRLDAPYEPGRRSRSWLKIKTVMRQEFVVGGWVPEVGTREHRVGAMLLGYHDAAGKLRYAGRVGTGLVGSDHAMLSAMFQRILSAKSPFAERVPVPGARFLEPVTVVEVEYRRWPWDGLVHQASYKGVREDKDPRAVVREVVA
jgi:bifunctional non-homologous end joining protein LigD